jgi:hypothetical protein
MSNSVLYMVPAQHKATINKLWELLGLGPSSFDAPTSATGTGAHEFYLGNYENMPAHEEAAVRGLKLALPELDPGDVWGQGGLPSEEDAQAAAAAQAFYIREDQSLSPVEHMQAILGALGQVLWGDDEEI